LNGSERAFVTWKHLIDRVSAVFTGRFRWRRSDRGQNGRSHMTQKAGAQAAADERADQPGRSSTGNPEGLAMPSRPYKIWFEV